MEKKDSKLFIIIISILSGVGVCILIFPLWVKKIFGDISLQQFISRMNSIKISSKDFYITTMLYVLVAVAITVLLIVLFQLLMKKTSLKMIYKKVAIVLFATCLLIYSLTSSGTKLRMFETSVEEVVKDEEVKPFTEDSYVVPTSEIVSFPEQKKNLILIYLESYESTYFSKELGGGVSDNLLPNLTRQLAEPDTINFSNNESYGGPYQAPNTGFSIAGMFATQSGLPFKTPVDGNEYGTIYDFMPGAITLGDILQKEGYNLEFLVGADGGFAGVTKFYQQHGNWNVLDHNVAKSEGRIPQDYKEWWGFEDRKLYDYSKEKLDKVSKSEQPFAMVIEADDTHFPDGYLDKNCPMTYSEPYANSISCTDSMVTNFIEYVKQQDYYKDTLIVVHGDHLSMERPYFERNVDPTYERTTFNAYINVDKNLIETANHKNRKMTTMDVFPTTLAAMNVSIKGERLGYGTNLFSNTATIYETYGFDIPNEVFEAKSERFYDRFLFSKKSYE